MWRPSKPFLKISAEAAIWLAIAAFAWAQTYDFAGKDMLFRWGADVWPRAVIIAIVAVAVVQFIAQRRSLKASSNDTGGSRTERPEQSTENNWAKWRVAAAILVPLIYLYFLPKTGYYATTPFFILAVLAVFGVHSVKKLFLTTLAIYGALLIIFTNILFVPMPTGYWPGFYDFSNWLIELIS